MTKFLLLYPEKKVVTEVKIMQWARDAAADGKIDAVESLQDAIRNLQDAGLITLGNNGRPVL